MQGTRRQFVILGAAWLVLVCSAAPAQIAFVESNETVGLNHINGYGKTFDFSDIPQPFTPLLAAAMQRNMGNGAAVGDYDRDGDLDLYLLNQMGFANQLWRNDVSDGLGFVQVTIDAGVGDTGFARVAHFVDLNNDGWDDLLLINDDRTGFTYPACRVFRNDHGRFVDETVGSGLAPPGVIKGGVCLGDYDGDGLLDVYVTLWLFFGREGPAVWAGHNRLYRNLGEFEFEDVTADAGVGTLARDSFSCAFADFDNDGDSDLYVAVDHTSDAYYRNDGGVFSDQTVEVGVTHAGNDMGIAVADFDGDGDLDVYSTNVTDPGGSTPVFGTGRDNTLLVNKLMETGTLSFHDEAGIRGVNNTAWGWGTEWLDADNDGDLDLYAVSGFDQWVTGINPFHPLVDTPAVLFQNNGAGPFAKVIASGAEITRDSRAAIAFDYDGDRDQDLLVTNINEPTAILQNVTVGGAGLDIRLFGGCGVNVDGVGTRIYVTVDGTTRMQEVLAGGSYLSGRPFVAHFGMGAHDEAAEVRVDWPDGTTTVLADVAAGQLVNVHKTPGDYDFSGSIDLADLAAYQRCVDHADLSRAPLCSTLDLDRSGVLDPPDLTLLVSQLFGPGVSVCPP